MKNWLNELMYFTLDLIYPNDCLICNQNIEGYYQSICDQCWSNFEVVPSLDRKDLLTCSEGIDRAYSGWYFKNGIDHVIHSLKYNDRAKLGLELGRRLSQLISLSNFKNIDAIIPVPLHKIKSRDRGYNQSEWIARGMSENWKIPVQSSIVNRAKYTVSQTTLDKQGRIENLKDAFKVKKNVNNLNLVLIDDVLTTGSTLSSCATALKNAGADKVYALTVSTPAAEDRS